MSTPSLSKLTRIDPATLRGNPRASFTAWLRYEPLVSAAVVQHPRPYIYQPTNMAASTVVTRIRDAVRGCIAFQFPSSIPLLDLQRWFTEVIFKELDGQVYIGPPKEVTSALQGVGKSNDSGLVFPTLSLEEVMAFTILLSAGRIVGPVTVLSPPDISLLPERPNVELAVRGDGSLVLL